MKSHFLSKALLISMFCTGVMQTANAADAISAEMTVLKVQADKKIALKLTDQVEPKDVLEYTVAYNNVSVHTLKDVRLNLPIPAHVTYTGKALLAPTYASIDGVNFAKAPLMRLENGKQVQIPFSEYRALQWEIKTFKPKQHVKVSAQVRVNSAE